MGGTGTLFVLIHYFGFCTVNSAQTNPYYYPFDIAWHQNVVRALPHSAV